MLQGWGEQRRFQGGAPRRGLLSDENKEWGRGEG